MMLTDLADACRKGGLDVREVDGWRTRGHGGFAAVETVVCHHTAGPATGNVPSLGVVVHGRPGLTGPLCNLALARDGTVHVVAAGCAWHAGDVRSPSFANDHAVGIEAEATGTGTWPTTQMDAYARLCAALVARYGIPVSRVLGHKEVCAPPGRKVDPNFDMDAFRARVRAATHPVQEDDMPLSKADLDKIAALIDARLGDVVPVPSNSADRFQAGNVKVTTATMLWQIMRLLRDVADKVGATKPGK